MFLIMSVISLAMYSNVSYMEHECSIDVVVDDVGTNSIVATVDLNTGNVLKHRTEYDVSSTVIVTPDENYFIAVKTVLTDYTYLYTTKVRILGKHNYKIREYIDSNKDLSRDKEIEFYKGNQVKPVLIQTI